MTPDELKLAAEYHRGFEDGKAARSADEWQLDRERQKVICELQKLRDRGSVWGRELIVAHGLSVEATNDDLCNRLIYLLGGDPPTLSDLYGIWKGEDQSQDDTLTRVSLKAKTYSYQILELADILGVDVNVGDDVADIGNMVMAKARQLTDERNFSTTETYTGAGDGDARPAETSGDADNYVIQITPQSQALASMGLENETKDTVEPVSQEKETLSNIWYDVMEHDLWITTTDKAPTEHSVNLQDAIDSILGKTGSVEDPKTPESVENLQEVAEMGEGEAPIASITSELRDAMLPCMDDDWLTIERSAFLAIADRIDSEHERMWQGLTVDMKPMTDENMAESGWVRLPVDADGEYIHIGDLMAYADNTKPMEVVAIVPPYVVMVEDGPRYADMCRHYHASTVEDVLRDFAYCCEEGATEQSIDEIIAEYAAKLRLAEGEDA